MKKKIAVVVQRCHQKIVGGSENLAWQYAQLLSEKYQVEILSTCAMDSRTWSNELPPGEETRQNVRIIRFPVTVGRTRNWELLHRLLVKQFSQSEKKINWSCALQEEWIRTQGPFSDGLHRYIEEHQDGYVAIIFVTYLYAPTYFGSFFVEKKKTFLVATLHDEPPAYLPVFQKLARRASKIFWNTRSEMDLGLRLWGEVPGRIVGMGIDTESCLKKNGSEHPYIFYCGRIDPGKGCLLLLEYFKRYKKKFPSGLQLVLTGDLKMKLPGRDDIDYRGFVGEDEKKILLSAARVFVMPSSYESLSISVLEAMAQRTPVMINSASSVLCEHIDNSRGGFGYKNYDEFEQGLRHLLSDPELRKSMGDRGREYVQARFSYQNVREALMDEIERL